MNEKIKLEGLLPDFQSLNSLLDWSTISGTFPPKNVEQFNEFSSAINIFNKIETSEQLSALFIVFLLIIFGIFIIISLYKFWKARKQTRWVLKFLKHKKSSPIITRRQELREKAQKKKKHQGAHLWLEFDESLIEVTDSEGKSRLYNTIDANHFFNSSTLAAGITESRMLAAVPGFLTAVGVIGTFVGLVLGLSELNIGNDVAISEMKNGLAHVISGAKIAFMTSVWGVALSVIFNIIEKLLEGLARNKIRKLQVRIDQIFQRLSAEFQLQQIVDDGHQSRESLQGLAEKIGEKMQESLLEVSDGIQKALEESLQKVMAPAIDKLVDETSDGNQKALESLVENFLSKFGELGETQRSAMDTASESVSSALNSMNTSMNEFLNKLEISQDDSSERDKKRQETFIEQTSQLTDVTKALLKQVDDGVDTHATTSKAILNQGEQLQIKVTDSIDSISEVSSSLFASSKELNESAKEIKSFGLNIKDASNQLSGSVIEVVKSTSDLSDENTKSRKIMNDQYEQISRDKEHIENTVTKLQQLIDSADTSFINMKDHQNTFLNDLKENVNQLAESMTQLLTDYSEQANAQTRTHLGEWATHITNYSTNMNNAVKALSSVIDEIEEKAGG